MRGERKLNKAIKQDGIDTQSDILDGLKRRYPQYVEQSGNKHVPARKRRFAFISALAAAVVCVAIVVPCAVLLPNKNNGSDNGGKDNIRYCAQGEYGERGVEWTILDYRESNNLNFLYFDWYESGEDICTYLYASKADDEVLCLEECAYFPDSDDLIYLSITKANVYISEFDRIISNCHSTQSVEDHTVKWHVGDLYAVCFFEDGGYRYFIQLDPGKGKDKEKVKEDLFNSVKELLGK